VSFAVDLVAEQRLIGRITLRDITAESARLGTYLHPAYTSQGFGAEALTIFCGHADRVLQLARLVLDVACDNERAIRCYRRCGFETVGAVERSGFTFLEMERYAPATTLSLGVGARVCAA
jgi:RimJ/RimL family protein N-acetyltransferase